MTRSTRTPSTTGFVPAELNAYQHHFDIPFFKYLTPIHDDFKAAHRRKVSCRDQVLEAVIGLPFISIDIPSELDRSTPTSSTFISGLKGGHEVFRGTHASNQIGGVNERKEVDILLTGRVKGSNSSDCLIEVVVSKPSGSSLVNRRQLDKVDGGTWCDSIVRIGFVLSSEWKVLLELDCKVLCSMWSAPISLIPRSRGAS